MSRLSADTLAAIASGAPVRQKWAIIAPRSAGGGLLLATATSIHDDDGGPYCVTKAGTYTVEGYNVAMADPGKLTSGMYRFTVDNSDGLFETTVSGNVFYNVGGSYQADPVECYVNHWVYVKVNGSWTTVIDYYGQINDVTYDDTKKTATISSVSMATVHLSQLWSAEDAEEQDTGLDVYL